MNERIFELIKEATEYAHTKNDSLHQFNLDALYEKFAELIVKECVSIVAKRKDQAIDDGWNVDEAMTMAEMDLEQHFGVEE